MESSSPLAAMHRPSMPHLFQRSLYGNSLFAESTGSIGSARPRPFQRTTSLLASEIRGSSPAASLCADLSQNLGLDAEAKPVFPTPRRALFPGPLQKKCFVSVPIGLESSPLAADPMDTSPPQAQVQAQQRQPPPQQFQPPRPIGRPPFAQRPSFLKRSAEASLGDMSLDEEDEMMVDSPLPATRHPQAEALCTLDRNRKMNLRRPSLSRSGRHSSLYGVSSCRGSTDSIIPQIRLNGENRFPSTKSSNMSVGELFEACSPPPQQQHQQQLPAISRLGSPIPGHVRRSSNQLFRARKAVRRSLSMFEHAADVMKPKHKPVAVAKTSDGALQVPSVADAVVTPAVQEQPILPHFLADDPTDTIPRISLQTLLEVLDGKYSHSFDQKMVIDCRFEYEYDGGHIDGAINYNNKELLARHLLETPMQGRTLLVFHCEYSAHRAPLMARHIRSEDRTANAEAYPRLTYPDVYILDGGYSAFFERYRGRCSPQNYVEMSDERHQRTCEREMGRLKARKPLGRAQTYAFGQQERSVFESPKSRPEMRRDFVDMIGNSPILGEQQHLARRMASY